MRDVDPSVVARWIQRALWVLLPLAVGPVVEAAVDGRSGPVRIAVALLAWTGWGVGLVATLVPRATSLTVLRVLGPGAAAVAVAAALLAGDDGASATGAVAVVAGALAAASVFAPAAVDSHVDGSSYGTERRFSLRCPPVLAALGAGTWLLVAAAVVTGPLLLAARQWAAGAASLAAGAIVAALGVRSLHQGVDNSSRGSALSKEGAVLGGLGPPPSPGPRQLVGWETTLSGADVTLEDPSHHEETRTRKVEIRAAHEAFAGASGRSCRRTSRQELCG